MRLFLMLCSEIPERVQPDNLYVALEHKTAVHLCPCGCGKEVVTPLKDGGWEFDWGEMGATLRPSILNTWCKSHYYITNDVIEWL